ncbi:MAG: circadian clock KaiB family protein [Candidatus Methanomethylicus sp.]|nr:circadian clock KaiB family protein [Candidatus Methanomethylicus sp.]
MISNNPVKDSFKEFKQAAKKIGASNYILRLYISGMTSRSLQAIENLNKICDDELSGRYKLEVIDISQQPESVAKKDIVATPTLVKELPLPIRKIVGDLSERERILVALNLQPRRK